MITVTLIGIIGFLSYHNLKIGSSNDKYKSKIRELEFERKMLTENVRKLVEKQNTIANLFKPGIN